MTRYEIALKKEPPLASLSVNFISKEDGERAKLFLGNSSLIGTRGGRSCRGCRNENNGSIEEPCRSCGIYDNYDHFVRA